MNMTRATRQIRPARIPNQESSAPIRVPSPLSNMGKFTMRRNRAVIRRGFFVMGKRAMIDNEFHAPRAATPTPRFWIMRFERLF